MGRRILANEPALMQAALRRCPILALHAGTFKALPYTQPSFIIINPASKALCKDTWWVSSLPNPEAHQLLELCIGCEQIWWVRLCQPPATACETAQVMPAA